MTDLSTSYMGLTLKNPIIVGSSDLTMSLERVRACEEAGAGAVVLKSLFEEQIEDDVRQARDQASFPNAHTKSRDQGFNLIVGQYLVQSSSFCVKNLPP